uniref:FimB/Mfa2 family fimbrial subunit n=1 Tax=uncultured Bacteroides sp. TaxID=162156 RepID=UPI00280AAA9A|nr:FimB/Mfa2 family fimbrial subunit [uncultured Bacteroides sp.]
MTGDYKFRFMPGILYSMFTLLLLSGCIAENNDDCFKGVPLKVNLPAGISPETIKDINFYVFDDKDLLLDILPTNSKEPVILNYPGIPTLHCIALCNTQDGTMLVSPLKKGDPLSGGFISLKPSVPTRVGKSTFTSPADLFYGELKIENTSTSARIEEQALAVSRMVASMNITVRGLELLSGSGGGDYSLVVHETASRLDFEGHYSGAPASYQFSPRFEAGKDYKIPPFNLFPTLEENKGLTIDIYRNGDLLRSLNTDSSHQPIIPVVGQTLNVLLDFKLSVSVEVELTAWGEETVWKEYN